MDYLLLEEFLPKSYQNEILEETIKLPFYLEDSIGYPDSNNEFLNKNFTDNPGFHHTLVAIDKGINSNYWDLFKPVLYFFEQKTNIVPKQILRVRLRLTLQTPGHDNTKYNAPHVDLPTQHTYGTLVYYINDSDGDTILFDKLHDPTQPTQVFGIDSSTKEIIRNTPKKGSGIFFNGHRYHSGNTPIKNKIRLIANYDFTL